MTQSRTAIRLSALAVTLGLLLTVVPLHMLKAGAVPAEIRGVTVAKVLGLRDEKYLSWRESHARDSYYIAETCNTIFLHHGRKVHHNIP